MMLYEIDNFGNKDDGSGIGTMQLTNGTRFDIRPALDGERPAIGMLLDGLGHDSKWNRFCGNPGDISKLWDKHSALVEAGKIREVDLVAVSDEEIIGHTMVVGRGVVDVAVAVSDRFAGQKVGTALTTAGLQVAKVRSDWAVKTDILGENRVMSHVLDTAAAVTGVIETRSIVRYGVTERCDRFVGSSAMPCSECEFSQQLGGCEIDNFTNRRL